MASDISAPAPTLPKAYCKAMSKFYPSGFPPKPKGTLDIVGDGNSESQEKSEMTTTSDFITFQTTLKWPPGSTLRIGFMNGTPAQRTFVQNTANGWLDPQVNLRFNFLQGSFQPPNPDLDILINLEPADGSFTSAIGTDCRTQIANGQPSMNLAVGNDTTVFMQGMALHEFGHALGAVHEHQTPVAQSNITWDRNAVNAVMQGPPYNWTQAQIDANYYDVLPANGLNGTVFDPGSIMIYAIPLAWTTNNFSAPSNNVLSLSDRRGLRNLYP